MCPSDPIWPIGPTLGRSYVERAGYPGRVQRRQRREDETDEQERRHRHHEPSPQQRWHGPLEEADAGTYDDHGRATHHRDDEDPPAHRHVDAVA